ncbi:MAG TPA: hypothetical protein VNZ52_06495 [Candidatus Thermoplasmatota archaeon]|nr:hypothetical protein [Candidatus Thermoplasmatota archaeon]
MNCAVESPVPLPASRLLVAALALGLLAAPAAFAATAPTRATHWMSLINPTHAAPTEMTVVVIPPGYYSTEAMVERTGWIGPNPLLSHPGTQAILEATDYWTWMIDQYEGQYPWLAQVSYTVKVLGVDATAEDLQDAEIIITTTMVADTDLIVYHLGLGLPTLPWPVLLNGNRGMDTCNVINTGFGQFEEDESPGRLRNLVIHEFGHCLGVGHTGTSLGLPHESSTGQEFDSHPTDVMSKVVGDKRQCLSNLNVLSLAEGYRWVGQGGTWRKPVPEVYLEKSAYTTRCMPASMNRF